MSKNLDAINSIVVVSAIEQLIDFYQVPCHDRKDKEKVKKTFTKLEENLSACGETGIAAVAEVYGCLLGHVRAVLKQL